MTKIFYATAILIAVSCAQSAIARNPLKAVPQSSSHSGQPGSAPNNSLVFQDYVTSCHGNGAAAVQPVQIEIDGQNQTGLQLQASSISGHSNAAQMTLLPTTSSNVRVTDQSFFKFRMTGSGASSLLLTVQFYNGSLQNLYSPLFTEHFSTSSLVSLGNQMYAIPVARGIPIGGGGSNHNPVLSNGSLLSSIGFSLSANPDQSFTVNLSDATLNGTPVGITMHSESCGQQ